MYRFRHFVLLILGSIILSFVLSCSEEKSATEPIITDENKIKSLFRTLATAYNSNDVQKGRDCFSASYLHNGNSEFYNVLFNAAFGSPDWKVEVSDIEPEVTDENATCSFYFKKSWDTESQSGSIEGFCPQDQDLGVHILRKEEAGWKIYGNQQ